MIAIIIHTFLRDDAIKKCVKSIEKHLDNYKLYITDSGEITGNKEDFYDELRTQGHEVIMMPFDCNWTYARNQIVKNVREKYVLYLDDDYIVTDKTDIELLKKHLKGKVGLVGGGVLQNGVMLNYNFKVKGEKGNLYYERILRTSKPQKLDVIANFWIAKKELLDECGWDDELNIGGGHSDFFLNIKFNSDWEIKYVPLSVIDHEQISNIKYNFKRKRTEWHKKFLNKWNNNNEIKIYGQKNKS